jgi:DNA-binding NarL/FixJ family response regulator
MMKILIVEDHELVCRGVKQTLAGDFPDASFAEARTFQEGVELLSREPWSLVLLDLILPGRSGFDLLEESQKLQPSTPVLVLSTYPEEEFAVRAIKLGAAGYVTKTSAADELVLAVRKVLAGGRYVTPLLAEKLAATIGDTAFHARHELLSARELEVLQLVATGKTVKEIASLLTLSEKTIATYRRRLAEKLGVSSNVELARYALHHHLVE